MATASYFGPIDCQASRNSSIDSILTGGTGLPELRITGHRHHHHHHDHPIDVKVAPSRRSTSLSRHRRQDEGGLEQARRVRLGTQSYSHDTGSSKVAEKSTTPKESGGRRILSFFQRGFNAKRTKPIGKGECKKSDNQYLGHESSLCDLTECCATMLSPAEGVRILGQQIYLPASVLSSYLVAEQSVTESRRQTTLLTSAQYASKIYPVDASLFDTSFRHCFQVVTYDHASLSHYKTDTSHLGTTPVGSLQSEAYNKSPGCPRMHTYSCPTAMERSRWILFLKRLVRPTRDAERRRENCLHIWIQEAKGLTGRHRYHCEILLDGRVYARTTSKPLTDMLFWGEEFDLSGLADFTTLTVEIWVDPDRITLVDPMHRAPSAHGTRDRGAGTSLPTSDQRTTAGGSFPFSKAMIACAKGSDLTTTSDEYDPNDAQRPAVKSDENAGNLKFGSKRGKSRQQSKRCSRQSALIASVHIPSTKLGLSDEFEAWYPADIHDLTGPLKRSDLIESTTGKYRSCKRYQPPSPGSGGLQLRIKTRYRSVCVLPLIAYSRLQQHLSQFGSCDHIDLTAQLEDGARTDSAVLLSKLDPWLGVKLKAELAGSVVALQQALGQAPEFLAVLILYEVHKQPDINMVLRGNSIATKAIEIYIRLIGETYLSNVLDEFVRTVLARNEAPLSPTEHHPVKTAKQSRDATPTSATGLTTQGKRCEDFEVDPTRLEHPDQLAQNQCNLLELVHMVWDQIVASEAYFPGQLRFIFTAVRQHLDGAFPTSNSPNESLSEHVICACLFLRFICPAILSPSLFGLTAEFPSDPKLLRIFTLVAKSIQSLANLSPFSGTKESYMTFMNQFVIEQLPTMRQFLRAISSPISSSMREPTLSSAPLSMIADGNRMTTSMSHHAGFVELGNATLWTDSGLYDSAPFMTRSSSGLPTITGARGSPLLPSSRPQTAEGMVTSSSGTNLHHMVDHPRIIREPIPLPELRTGSTKAYPMSPNPGDHVDVALCLALCHSHLSEAVAMTPAEKPNPLVEDLKPILDEIDFFLASGVDPRPNWWCVPSTHVAEAQTPPITDTHNVLSEQNGCCFPHSPYPSKSVTSVQVDTVSDSGGSDGGKGQNNGVWKTVILPDTSRRRDSNPPVASNDLGEGKTMQRVGSATEDEQQQLRVQFPVFVIPGTPPCMTRPQCSDRPRSTFTPEDDDHENIDPTGGATPISMARLQHVTTNPSGQQSRATVCAAPDPRVNSLKLTSSEQQINRSDQALEPDPVSATTTTTTLDGSPNRSRDSPTRTASANLSKELMEYPYAGQCNSSGYHSLGSHETGSVDHASRRQATQAQTEDLAYCSTVSSVALAMNNPLYIVHSPSPNSVASSQSHSSQSSPSKDSITGAVHGSTDPKSSDVRQGYNKRHTYVNLTNQGATDAMLAAVRNKIDPENASSSLSVEGETEACGTAVSKNKELNPSGLTIGSTQTPQLTGKTRTNGLLGVNRSKPDSRHVTTLHAVLEGYDIKPMVTGTDSVRSTGYATNCRRSALPMQEFRDSIPASIRDELDASQARLAEAQARLLANEAERIQLLRAWHNELMRQSQLVSQRQATGPADDPSDEVMLSPTAWTTVASDWRASMIQSQPRSSPATMWTSTTAEPFHSTTSFRSHRPHTQPRMGAAAIGGATLISATSSGQSTLPRDRPAARRQPLRCSAEPTTFDQTRLTRSPSSPGLYTSPGVSFELVHGKSIHLFDSIDATTSGTAEMHGPTKLSNRSVPLTERPHT